MNKENIRFWLYTLAGLLVLIGMASSVQTDFYTENVTIDNWKAIDWVNKIIHLNVSASNVTTDNSYTDNIGEKTSGAGITMTNNVTMTDNVNITGNLTYKTIYAQLSSSQDQTFANADTKQAINYTTIDESSGLDISVANITIQLGGVYDIAAQPQVSTGGGGAGTFHMWLEKHNTTDWLNVSNSNVELILANNEENVIPLIATLRLEANEKIRIMGSVSNTAITLDAQTPAGEPAIPSIICRVFRLGE